MDAIWDHIWHLSTRWLTTKQSMEDLIGSAADRSARDQKKEHQSMERAFFYLANSKRLNTTDFRFLRLEKGDLSNPSVKASMNRKNTFVATSERSKLAQNVKEALTLQSRGFRHSDADFVAQPMQPMGKNLWKPGGQTADNREVASMMALRHTEKDGFQPLEHCWASFLLQEGQLFTRRDDAAGLVYLSLGFKHMATWGIRVEQVDEDMFQMSPEPNNITLNQCRANLLPMLECGVGLGFDKVQMQSEWLAVPSAPCSLATCLINA